MSKRNVVRISVVVDRRDLLLARDTCQDEVMMHSRQEECHNRCFKSFQTACPDGRVFDDIYKMYSIPMFNLLVTYLNKKLLAYVSPLLDPLAWKEDAFQSLWGHLKTCMFPPFTVQ